MKRCLSLLVVLLLVAVPLWAGDEEDKDQKKKEECSASTQECLNYMVKNGRGRGIIGVDGEWDTETNSYRITAFVKGSTG